MPGKTVAWALLLSLMPLYADRTDKGVHNVLPVMDGLSSGSSPEGEAGFASLKKLGIKTIISVDGAKPTVELARKHGMGYVHLPLGYSGISQTQAWRLAKAVRVSRKPVYIHCHHGQHRGPAAAATVWRCLDKECTAERALAFLKKAGTDPKYAGLFDAVAKVRRPTAAELDAVDAKFPQFAVVDDLTSAMVQIDQHWDNLLIIKAAGWVKPKNHPDLDPASEARQLAESFQQALALPRAKSHPDDFRDWLNEGAALARVLERSLRQQQGPRAADRLFRASAEVCSHCHAKYRN